MFFFFKQKTAYEMRISDWSSDVCSSDLADKVHPIDSPDHVVFGGFDGDATAYSLMAEGTLDADGVQDLFYEAELAVNAIVDLQAGRPVEKVLLDPGFAITQANLEEKKEAMWGYHIHKNS